MERLLEKLKAAEQERLQREASKLLRATSRRQARLPVVMAQRSAASAIRAAACRDAEEER
jgi:hypothetical protein